MSDERDDDYTPLSYFEARDRVIADGDWDDDEGYEPPPRAPRTHDEEAQEMGRLNEFYGHDGWHVESTKDSANDWVAADERERSGDMAGRWLTQNDPEYKRNKVEAAITRAARERGLTLDEVRGAFGAGRPSKDRLELRERVRVALFWVWESENRSAIADVLGTDRPAIYRLFNESVTS